MKILSMLIALIGGIAVLLAFVALITANPVFNVSAQGYLRGAPALFLMALVLIAFDQFYMTKNKKK
jgi:hypothetical protein